MFRSVVLAAGVCAMSSSAGATMFASNYVPSQTSGVVSGYDPQAALGAPSGQTGIGTPYVGILSPFSPDWGNDIVDIGGGGRLTLQFPNFIKVGGGAEVGVVSNNFLVDAPPGSGNNTNPATVFGSGQTGGGVAEVLVSDDGLTWHSIGTQTFDRPANYYSDATDPYQSTPGNEPADFGIPFTLPISAFDGLNGLQTIQKFGTSGGGTWLDLAPSGLSQIDYIQFRVPSGGELVIDSVSANNNDVGAAVPEPGCLALLSTGIMLFARKRK